MPGSLARVRASLASTLAIVLPAIALDFALAWLFYVTLEGRVPESTLALWHQWDAKHYLDIARRGYVGPEDPWRIQIAFFPLFPYLARLARFVTGDLLTGALLVANLSFVVSAALLREWLLPTLGRRGAGRAVALYAFFPTAYFLRAPYTESLFLALALASLLQARAGRWAWAGLLGALATATRLPGAALLVGLALEYLRQRPLRARALDRGALGLVLAGAGLAFFLVLNWVKFGHPLQFLAYQREHWHREVAWPWTGMIGAWRGLGWRPPAEAVMVAGAELVAGLVGLLLIALGWRRFGAAERGYSAVSWLLGACSSFWFAQPRFLLTIFPLYGVLARLTRRDGVFAATLAGFALLHAWWLAEFVRGRWAF